MRRSLPFALLALASVACGAPAAPERAAAGDGPAGDPVAALGLALAEGRRELSFDRDRGYLDAVLQALDVPAASQVLVHSPTSRQRQQISAANPRAIYFNDTTAVAWVPGAADLELITFSRDERAHAFYTLKQQRASVPRFETGERCFECHTIEGRGLVQGWLVRSSVQHAGQRAESLLVGDETPLAARWGGWYVSGGEAAGHLGVPVPEGLPGYLASGSDIGALMVLAHQASLTNLIAAVHSESARSELREVQRGGNAPAADLEARIEELAGGLLFLREAPLPGPLRPARTFLDAFAAGARRDSRGRSLRDLDLTRHLQQVRCSYMIDSAPFRALPVEVRLKVYRRIRKTLDDPVNRIPTGDRQLVLDHLAEILPDWPAPM